MNFTVTPDNKYFIDDKELEDVYDYQVDKSSVSKKNAKVQITFFVDKVNIGCERLEINPNNLANCEVVCVESPYTWWTIGKIYRIDDGYVMDDANNAYGPYFYGDSEIYHIGKDATKKSNLRNKFVIVVDKD